MGQENFNDLLKQRASEFKITPGEGAFESVMQKRKAEKSSHRRGWLFFTAAAAVLVAVTVWLWPVSPQGDQSRLAQSGGSQGRAVPADNHTETSVIVRDQGKNEDHNSSATAARDVPVSNEQPATTSSSSFSSSGHSSQIAAAQAGLAADAGEQVTVPHKEPVVYPQAKNKPAKQTVTAASREKITTSFLETSPTEKTALVKLQKNNPAKAEAKQTRPAETLATNVRETTADVKNDHKPESTPVNISAAASKEETQPGTTTTTTTTNTANTNDAINNTGNGIAQIQSIPDSVSQQPPIAGGTSPKSASLHKWAVNIYHNQYFINQNKNTAKASSAVWPANSTPNEQAKSAFASGISLEYIISNRFSVSVGFNYGKVNFEHLRFTSVDTVFDTNQSSPLQPSTGSESTKVYQKNITDKQLTFVEIPVMAGFLAGAGKWKFHLQAGAAYQYLQSTSTYVFTRDSSIVETTEKNDIGSGRFNRSNIVVMTSATINYEVGKHFWIYAGPSARFNVLSHYESSYAIRPAAAHYGMQGGIKILF